MISPTYVGIDLGTTNSTAAVFDGSSVTPIRNAQGTTLTPSVVRIDAKGVVTVGARARKFLDSDPKNTRSEFKRLMGTEHRLEFAASGTSKRPEELAAEVLKSLRADVQEQLGFAPDVAVISVPALFEVTQTAATSEAARLAGFSRVEMIQEPVASAIAAGWSADDVTASWLVYDLGGGTFDASLLATNEGLLRVVGHDGDNFLGGRDFDARLVEWALGEIGRANNCTIDPSDAKYATGLRKLRHAAEDAKIELTRAKEATMTLSDLFEVGGASVDADLMLTRETLDSLAAPLVERSIAVCQRLLAAHGSPKLDRVVLVGGPTAMPILRARVEAALGAPFRSGLDPMTLVAQGAALYAATAGLDARPKKDGSRGAAGASAGGKAGAARTNGHRVWLQYPAMTPDTSPFVVGKVLVPATGTSEQAATPVPVATIAFEREDGTWKSDPEPVDAEGAFAVQVNLLPRAPNGFHVVGRDASGANVALEPASITLVHGVTISDPPLSRSIGVALSNDRVHVYFERGAPLPLRRTFTLRTVETVSAGATGFALKVPIVQGEFAAAHLCRLVGSLEIPGNEVHASLPAGSEIELTLELDRGGRLSASARVPRLNQVFDSVAHLVAPHVAVEELEPQAHALRVRCDETSVQSMKRGSVQALEKLNALDVVFDELEREIVRARGGDADAAEKSRRTLLEIDAAIGDADAELAWPTLEQSVRSEIAWASSTVSQHGSETEKNVLEETLRPLNKALVARDSREVERQRLVMRRLANAAYFRQPDAWREQFELAASRAVEATDPKLASQLIREGREAVAKNDRAALSSIVPRLQELLPGTINGTKSTFSSGSAMSAELDLAIARWRDNPFYVLGLTPECARADVERAGQKLIGMLEVGVASAKTYATPVGPGERTADKVRGAMAALRDPEQRLVHEVWARLPVDRSRNEQPGGTATDSSHAPWTDAMSALGWRVT